jgi:hypothetical protein
MQLLTHLPGTSDHPAYRIFNCCACGALEWHEKTTDKPA